MPPYQEKVVDCPNIENQLSPPINDGLNEVHFKDASSSFSANEKKEGERGQKQDREEK